MRVPKKRTAAAPTPIMVYEKIFQLSPGGASRRGPWGPNAIQYAISPCQLGVSWKICDPGVIEQRQLKEVVGYCIQLGAVTFHTYQPSSPQSSTHSNRPSSCPAEPSTDLPAPEAA